MCMLDEILARRDEVNELARKNRAGRMFVFGSCARKEETPESDIDSLVERIQSAGDRAELTAIWNENPKMQSNKRVLEAMKATAQKFPRTA